MRKIYLFIVAIATVFVACDKGGGIDPPPTPTPDPTIAVTADTAWYNGQATVTWSTQNATTLTLNGTAVALSGSKTFTNMTKDSTLSFVIVSPKGTKAKTVTVKTHSREVTLVSGGPGFPFGTHWKHAKNEAKDINDAVWSEITTFCQELSFKADGSWYQWKSSCTNGMTDGPGATKWEVYYQGSELVFRWGTSAESVWVLKTLTENKMVWYQRLTSIIPGHVDIENQWTFTR